ncbi:hypothetical protein [Streptomyces inhibens]|uniref:hypothetical protein n=1 Tax=Streptomyces inhibens TaxID=2293571 RepID=UPI000FFC4328|nr:hypothetical protein [Streptomyces inhibens]
MYYAGFDDLSALPVTDASNAYAVTASIKRAVLDTVAARTEARGVHFTGDAGDAVLSAPPRPPSSSRTARSSRTTPTPRP